MAEPQRTPTLWHWIRQGWRYFKLGINPPPFPPACLYGHHWRYQATNAWRECEECGMKQVSGYTERRGLVWHTVRKRREAPHA